jgi:6-pyruvoyltetrahydropterin/6-carboxytetrahydropterin synthase
MAGFETRISGRFCAAVQLDAAHAVCGRLHGHDYKVVLSLSYPKLRADGMTVDYYGLKKQFDDALAYVGHQHLNALPEFEGIEPTSEAIAQWFFDRLKKKLPALKSVSVSAYPDFEVTYYG